MHKSDTITLSQDQFQMILAIMKFFSLNENLKTSGEIYIVKGYILKKFLLKEMIIPIELKNRLISNFTILLSSFDNAILLYEKEFDNLKVTKNQICNLIKPMISQAAYPSDYPKLRQFFNLFTCQTNDNDFFIEIL